jgi:predicted AAA+ superfamily ATPase
VVLLGPRQVGKTTLARAIAEARGAVYLDLEAPGDRVKLADPQPYLSQQADRLVVLDEIRRVPQLFETLRGQIDDRRRSGCATSPRSLRQSADDRAEYVVN